MMKSPQKRKLDFRVMQNTVRIGNLLEKMFGIKWFKPSYENQIRLLKLAQWEERYRVSMVFILRNLVPLWRKQYGKFVRGNMGFNIGTLTGRVSEKILRSKIVEYYPDGENKLIWRAQQQQRQIATLRDGVRQWRPKWENPEQDVREYRKNMNRQRKEIELFAEEMRKRPYRGNPWV